MKEIGGVSCETPIFYSRFFMKITTTTSKTTTPPPAARSNIIVPSPPGGAGSTVTVRRTDLEFPNMSQTVTFSAYTPTERIISV
jgi:hypothetical protein